MVLLDFVDPPPVLVKLISLVVHDQVHYFATSLVAVENSLNQKGSRFLDSVLFLRVYNDGLAVYEETL